MLTGHCKQCIFRYDRGVGQDDFLPERCIAESFGALEHLWCRDEHPTLLLVPEDIRLIGKVGIHRLFLAHSFALVIVEVILHKVCEDSNLRRYLRPPKALKLPAVEFHHTERFVGHLFEQLQIRDTTHIAAKQNMLTGHDRQHMVNHMRNRGFASCTRHADDRNFRELRKERCALHDTRARFAGARYVLRILRHCRRNKHHVTSLEIFHVVCTKGIRDVFESSEFLKRCS